MSGQGIQSGEIWRTDGRTIHPVTSPPGDFDVPGTAGLAAYNGMSADGDWTLAVADVSAGGGQSKVLGWSLVITVPGAEPVPERLATGPATGVVAAALLLAAALMEARRVKHVGLRFPDPLRHGYP